MPDDKREPFWSGNPDLSSRVDDAVAERKAAMPPAFSDDDLALRFTRQHGATLRYVAGWGKWLEWDGRRWEFDKTLRVFDLSRLVCRAAAAEAKEDADDIASARRVAAVEKMSRADRRHAATVDQFDVDP